MSTHVGDGLSLSTLLNGELEDLFQEELKKCLHDMADLNKPARKARKISVEISLMPSDSRAEFSIVANAKASLPTREAVSGTAFLAQRGGRLMARAVENRQMDIERDMMLTKKDGETVVSTVKNGETTVSVTSPFKSASPVADEE